MEDKLDSRRLGSQLITLRMEAPPSSKRVAMNMFGWIVWNEDSINENIFRNCELMQLRRVLFSIDFIVRFEIYGVRFVSSHLSIGSWFHLAHRGRSSVPCSQPGAQSKRSHGSLKAPMSLRSNWIICFLVWGIPTKCPSMFVVPFPDRRTHGQSLPLLGGSHCGEGCGATCL